MKPSCPVLWLAIGLLSSVCGSARATVSDSFESATTSWHVIHRDCWYRLDEHRRTFDEARSGVASEFVRVTAGLGSEIYLGHRVAAARVITELSPSLWVRADRAGFQLLARVVLPRTNDPRTGEPLTVFVVGDVYDQPSTWRELRIDNLKQQLEQQVRVIRQQRKGLRIDPLEAYVDHVIVNVHPGSGSASIWLDDLNLAGFATAFPPAGLVAAGHTELPEQASSAVVRPQPAAATVRVQGSLVMVDERPFFARIVQHHGERLAWLQSLGFNTVWLARPPTVADHQEASRLGLWLIAPPSLSSSGDERSGLANGAAGGSAPRAAPGPAQRLLAWHAGTGLTVRDFGAVRDLAARLRTTGSETPLAAEAESGAAQLANEADIIVLHRPTPGTSCELSEFGDWLRDQRTRVRREQPFWVTIPTEPAFAQLEQLALLARDAPPPAALVEPAQIRLLAYHAVSAGARGLCFTSTTPLDATDPASQQRAAVLRSINQELAAIEPWAAAGDEAGEVHTSDPLVRAHLLKTDRSRLLIATRNAAQQQFVVGPSPADSSVTFDIGALPITDEAYRIRNGDVRPVAGRSGGASLQCDDVGLVTVILLTQDPLAVNHVARTLGANRASATELRQRQTELQLVDLRELVTKLAALGQAVPAAEHTLAEADFYLQRGRQLLQTGDQATGWEYADQAANRLRTVRQAAWRQTVLAFPSPVSSPLCLSCRTLPAHFELSRSGLNWGVNLLPAGDFEDLPHLVRSGWRHDRDLPPGLQATVDLTTDDARAGRSALRIQVHSTTVTQAGDNVPVTITSAPIAVRHGRLARIRGWVKIPRDISGSRDGLLIYDSMSGRSLAERVTATRGWREFTLYRAAPRDGPLSVVFVLTGIGEAWIDDVTVSLEERSAR